MEKLEFTKALVIELGSYIKSILDNHLEINSKSSKHDFVTNVDKEVERRIIDSVTSRFENQDFITEEKTVATKGLKEMWIIDPIDGTMNFIMQKKNFAISIAYYEDETPVFGIVYDVMNDKLMWAVKGKGAYINDKKLKNLEQVVELEDILINISSKTLQQYATDPIKKIMGQRYIGSAALEICEVAIGASNAYVSKRVNSWDVAAATLILSEVGGVWNYGANHDTISLEMKQHPIIAASSRNVIDYIESWGYKDVS